MTPPTRAAASAGPRRAVRTTLLVAALALVPWSVQVYDTGATFYVFAWGFASGQTLHVVPITDYFFRYTAGTPGYVSAWPVAVFLWALALASAAVPLAVDRSDPRVTAGLLALSGLAQVPLSRGFAVQPTRTAYPVGTLAALLVAAAVWWRALAHR